MRIMTARRKCFSIILAVVLALALSGNPSALAANGGSQPSRNTAIHLPAEVIFQNCAEAIFMLETFDEDGESIRTGSGFFISDTGLAVTNLHVIDNATSATITLHNGDIYPVMGVNAASKEFNLAIISVESDENDWKHLTLADSDQIAAGNTVYVIGSPLGLINTMTAGIISKTSRTVGEETLIQFTAPISFGSGGSPVLNTRGQVIGVASSSFSYGQHLNLAVPINHVKQMDPGDPVAFGK